MTALSTLRSCSASIFSYLTVTAMLLRLMVSCWRPIWPSVSSYRYETAKLLKPALPASASTFSYLTVSAMLWRLLVSSLRPAYPPFSSFWGEAAMLLKPTLSVPTSIFSYLSKPAILLLLILPLSFRYSRTSKLGAHPSFAAVLSLVDSKRRVYFWILLGDSGSRGALLPRSSPICSSDE